jgi:ATP-dependent RNA helicase DeaD
MTFQELGISDQFIQALEENQIISPTNIQEQAIPFLLRNGTDFVGQAQTGTGKTAAFGLPLLHQIDSNNNVVQGLILCPTRELGQQIAKQLFRFTKYSERIFTEAVYGGEKIDIQIGKLLRPTHIIVATPGRLIDLLERKAVDISNVQTLVLDEADEMLTKDFKTQLDTIVSYIKSEHHTWLFSATMPYEIQKIIKNYMSSNVKHVQVQKGGLMNEGIEHQYVMCNDGDKLNGVHQFLRKQGNLRGILFTRTRKEAIKLSQQLIAKNYAVDCIHGELTQKEREKAMRAFKGERIQYLVATDISARGIDVNDLAFVLHYQMPDQLEYYTHRAGRTARAGKKGLSLCFANSNELKMIKRIQKELGVKMKELS